MKTLKSLLQKMEFGNEAADDADSEELASYFVEQETFREFLDSRKRIRVATAKKGVGKSALLEWTKGNIRAKDSDALIVKCRGADLVRGKWKKLNDPTSPSDFIQNWMLRICGMINRELARSLTLAISDDDITLVEAAEIEGYKSRNLVGCLVDRFKKLLKSAPEKLECKNEHEMSKRAIDRTVWFLIDDLDATFQMTNEECLELSTFFSACRYLCQDIKDIKFRITMRSDVWPIIRRYDESLDKLDQYVFEILWKQRDFRELLYLRIIAHMKNLDIPLPIPPDHVSQEEIEEYLLRQVFERKMQWGDRQRHTYKVIYTLAYERPRWAIQLCKLAQASALRRKASLISKDHIDEVWGEYGTKRISDLVAEHKHQCKDVEELLVGFRGAERLMTRQDLLTWIKNHITNHMTPIIEGREAKSSREIARFLYRIGFILARSDSDGESGSYEHYAFDGESGSYEHYAFNQMPDFLSSRTNEDFNLKWEIHPCYREALDIRKIDRSHRDRFGMLRGMQYD